MADEGIKEVHPVLSVVIPIGGKSPNVDAILSWLTPAVLKDLKVIIIFDSLSPELASQFQISLTKFNSPNLIILKSDCKNPGGTRNVGLVSVDTSWVAFWDADDFPQVPAVLKAVRGASPDKSIIRGFYSVKSEKTGLISVPFGRHLDNDFSNLFTTGPGLWRYVFRTETVLNVRFPNLSMAEDQIFLFRSLTTIKEVEDVSENFYVYLVNSPDQLTNTREKLADLIKAFHQIVNDFKPGEAAKDSAFTTIIARIILTSRLNPLIFLELINQLVNSHQITFRVKIKIIQQIFSQVLFYMRTR